VRFEYSKSVTLKNSVFRGVTLCGSYKNRRFGGMSFLTRAARRHIPEDGILDYSGLGNESVSDVRTR
jgi:hypothetical protein